MDMQIKPPPDIDRLQRLPKVWVSFQDLDLDDKGWVSFPSAEMQISPSLGREILLYEEDFYDDESDSSYICEIARIVEAGESKVRIQLSGEYFYLPVRNPVFPYTWPVCTYGRNPEKK
jgi:hypothetical protein